MCELLGMSSSVAATVNLSLAVLSEHGGLTGPHRDGWGVAYYEGRDVRVIKDADAASDSDWIRFLRDHPLRSPIVIAHIRHATAGERAYRNTQPFTRELGGRMHLFAHNGRLPGIGRLPRSRSRRFQPIGETDSERAFCMLLDRLARLWGPRAAVPPLAERLRLVVAFAHELAALGPANFLYSDGDALFAHGHRRLHPASGRIEPPGLVCLERRCRAGPGAYSAAGLEIGRADQQVVLVASVPLSGEAWQPLPEGDVMAIRNGRIVEREPAFRPRASAVA
jgi:glutamine amidotransferase